MSRAARCLTGIVLVAVTLGACSGDSDQEGTGIRSDSTFASDDSSDPGATDTSTNDDRPTGSSSTGTKPSTTEGESTTRDGAATSSSTAGTTIAAKNNPLAAVLPDLIAFVEQQRGHPFKTKPNVELAADKEFEAALAEQLKEAEEDLIGVDATFQALGVIKPGADLFKIISKLYAGGVVGFYDPKTKKLLVRGTSASAYVRGTVVHELAHALQDQYFDIDRPDLDEADDETGSAFSALVEGDAVNVEQAYRESLSTKEASAYDREERALAGKADLSGIPFFIIELFIALPYQDGPRLVRALLDDGGYARVDAAFSDPPVTSEQVLHPSRYLKRENGVKVDPPKANGKVVDQGNFGESGFLYFLATEGIDGAEAAANGWGGDWYVSWREGSRACLKLDVVMDTERDAAELVDALEAWAKGRDDTQVERDAERTDALHLTSCR